MNYKFDNDNHVHSLDGRALTGTSSVGNVLAKPALIQWAANMACGYIKDNCQQDDLMRYLVNLADLEQAKVAHRKKKEKAAGEGTDLHAELEAYVKAEMGLKIHPETYDAKILPFIYWASKNVKKFIASEAHCYDEELWVGGITDCVAELNDGRYVVIDFKSSKEAYITHWIQASGYAIQIDKNGLFSEDGEHAKKLDKPIEALIVIPFGAKELNIEIKSNIEDYKTGFRNAVSLYRLMGLDK